METNLRGLASASSRGVCGGCSCRQQCKARGLAVRCGVECRECFCLALGESPSVLSGKSGLSRPSSLVSCHGCLWVPILSRSVNPSRAGTRPTLPQAEYGPRTR